LVAYYPISGNAGASIRNRNHGTASAATLTTDRIGNSSKTYSFDGNSFISIADDDLLDLTKDFSISSWFYQIHWDPVNPF
jgi:hypothetical protein